MLQFIIFYQYISVLSSNKREFLRCFHFLKSLSNSNRFIKIIVRGELLKTYFSVYLYVEKNNAVPKKNPKLLLPISLAILTSLVVFCIVVACDPMTTSYLGTQWNADIFSQGKFRLLLVISLACLGIFVTNTNRIHLSKCSNQKEILVILGGIGIFLFFSLLSAVFSQYGRVAFFGYHNRAEEFITFLFYAVLFFYTLFVFHEERDFRYLVLPLMIVLVLNVIVGISQLMGHDLLNTSLGKFFMAPFQKIASFEYIVPGTVNGLFYHYNYVGSFSVLCLPIFAINALFSKRKEKSTMVGAICGIVPNLTLYQ